MKRFSKQPFLAVIPLYEADYPRVTHPSAAQSPFCPKTSRRFARLACVRHAASVHPEPGSNSQIKVFVQDQNQAWLNFYPVYLLLGCSLRTILFRIVQGYVTVQLSKCCLLFCDSVSLSCDSFYTLSHLFVSVKRFFQLFSKPFFQNLYPLPDRLKGVCVKFEKL